MRLLAALCRIGLIAFSLEMVCLHGIYLPEGSNLKPTLISDAGLFY